MVQYQGLLSNVGLADLICVNAHFEKQRMLHLSDTRDLGAVLGQKNLFLTRETKTRNTKHLQEVNPRAICSRTKLPSNPSATLAQCG
jgi:hypothetical protein